MWIYNGKPFNEEDIGNHIGFIYLITELDTNRLYIGQKVFFNKVAKRPLKGKKNRRLSKKPSDWKDYYGSNDELKRQVELKGPLNYKREIIRLCKAKSEMNYWETYEIYNRHALLIPELYYNSWVSCKVNRNQIKALITEHANSI